MPAAAQTDPGPWAQRAWAAHGVLLEEYGERSGLVRWPGLFRTTSPRGRGRMRLHYWWQAHALDALVDAQERSPSPRGLQRIRAFSRGIRFANRGRIINDYFDDMAWMGLALLRADGVGAGTAPLARRLWSELARAWNAECGGGIPWRRSSRGYKNTPANGPAAILAARLHRHDGDQDAAEWAARIVAWLRETLVDPDSGLAWDGINRDGDGGLDERLYTYNQGVLIGAELELRSIGGDPEGLARARRAARSTIERIAVGGVLPDEGEGDGGLFKGILVRYLAELEDPEAREFLLANGEAAWAARDDAGRFGPSWTEPPRGGADLSAHLSGLMLVERLAALEARGDLPPL